MTQAFVVLTLLVMHLVVHAVIDEPGLSRFCRQLSLDMPGGLTAEQRVEENNICKQVFPYAMKGRKASELCRYFAPFPIANITEADDSVTCRWKSLTTCKSEKSILIKGKCLYLGMIGVLGNFSETKDACPIGGKIHRVTDDHDARWITRHSPLRNRQALGSDMVLLPNTRPVYVANRKNDTSREMMVNDLIWDGDDFRKDESDVDSLALLMKKNDLHETDAGKIIKVDKRVMLEVVCSEYAVTYAGADGGESVWNALPEGIATSANKRVIVTSSVYQPTATSNKNIDTKHFHDVCKKICRNCFVALSGMPELTATDEIYYIPARLQTDEVKESDKCIKHKFSDVLRALFHQQLRTGKRGTIDTSSWESTYPDNMCADAFRTAVVSQKNGKIKDSPAITRHRLTCVVGDEPGVEPFSLCRANSEPDGNGGCKCKETFIDVTNTSREEADWFAKGQWCVPDRRCGFLPRSFRVYFLVPSYEGVKASMRTARNLMIKMVQEFPAETEIVMLENDPWRDHDPVITTKQNISEFSKDNKWKPHTSTAHPPDKSLLAAFRMVQEYVANAEPGADVQQLVISLFAKCNKFEWKHRRELWYRPDCSTPARTLQEHTGVRLISIPTLPRHWDHWNDVEAEKEFLKFPLSPDDAIRATTWELYHHEDKYDEMMEQICKKSEFDKAKQRKKT